MCLVIWSIILADIFLNIYHRFLRSRKRQNVANLLSASLYRFRHFQCTHVFRRTFRNIHSCNKGTWIQRSYCTSSIWNPAFRCGAIILSTRQYYRSRYRQCMKSIVPCWSQNHKHSQFSHNLQILRQLYGSSKFYRVVWIRLNARNIQSTHHEWRLVAVVNMFWYRVKSFRHLASAMVTYPVWFYARHYCSSLMIDGNESPYSRMILA